MGGQAEGIGFIKYGWSGLINRELCRYKDRLGPPADLCLENPTIEKRFYREQIERGRKSPYSANAIHEGPVDHQVFLG